MPGSRFGTFGTAFHGGLITTIKSQRWYGTRLAFIGSLGGLIIDHFPTDEGLSVQLREGREIAFWVVRLTMDSLRRPTLESHVAYSGSHRRCHEPSTPTDPRTRDCPVLPVSGWVAVVSASLPVVLPQPSGAVRSWLTGDRLPQGILARPRAGIGEGVGVESAERIFFVKV